MNIRLMISACLSLHLLAGSLQAAPPAVTELNLMTGREAGTCYQMGRDLKKLVSRHSIDLAVIPSAGSLDVGAVLFTSDKGPDEERCHAIGRFAKTAYDSLEELSRVGHPQWKSVNIDREALLKVPHLSPCVTQAFK